MSSHYLEFNEVIEIIEKLRAIVRFYQYEIINDTPIDGAEFLEEMLPILRMFKKELR